LAVFCKFTQNHNTFSIKIVDGNSFCIVLYRLYLFFVKMIGFLKTNHVSDTDISLKWELHFTDTICMDKYHSVDADNFLFNQHTSSSHILWNQKPNYHIHNSSPLCCTVKKLKVSDILTPCLQRKYFNIIQTCF